VPVAPEVTCTVEQKFWYLRKLLSFELGCKSGLFNKIKTFVTLLRIELRSFELGCKSEHFGEMRILESFELECNSDLLDKYVSAVV
jgi:hypothetical protein